MSGKTDLKTKKSMAVSSDGQHFTCPIDENGMTVIPYESSASLQSNNELDLPCNEWCQQRAEEKKVTDYPCPANPAYHFKYTETGTSEGSNMYSCYCKFAFCPCDSSDM